MEYLLTAINADENMSKAYKNGKGPWHGMEKYLKLNILTNSFLVKVLEWEPERLHDYICAWDDDKAAIKSLYAELHAKYAVQEEVVPAEPKYKVFKCTECELTFRNQYNCETHTDACKKKLLKKTEVRKPSTCEDCGKIYKNKASYETHILTCKQEQEALATKLSAPVVLHTCQHCTRVFKSLVPYNKHIAMCVVEANKPIPIHTCGNCNRQYTRPDKYALHIAKCQKTSVDEPELCDAVQSVCDEPVQSEAVEPVCDKLPLPSIADVNIDELFSKPPPRRLRASACSA